MHDSILEKYIGKELAEPDPAKGESLDNLGAFGLLRGVGDRAVMLELQWKDGSSQAFGYPWLDRATFDPSDGITLHFGPRTVKLIGRNLDAEIRPNVTLFTGILRHRVPWIREADSMSLLQANPDAILIEDIFVEGGPNK